MILWYRKESLVPAHTSTYHTLYIVHTTMLMHKPKPATNLGNSHIVNLFLSLFSHALLP